ncbi:MAG: Dickkopf N-terminal cysteine-rich domain-containing protein [Myxococcota bacterium]
MRSSFIGHHTDALRWTLLTALGLSPLSACGGNTSDGGNGGAPGTGGVTQGLGGATAQGGTSFGGASGSGGRIGTGGLPGFPCLTPMPLPTDPTGSFIQCRDGWKHRPEAKACPSKLPRQNMVPPSMYPEHDECTTDADCTARPNGHCEGPNSNELAPPVNGCFYGCLTDADCAANGGGLCECGDLVGTCVMASCKTDGDCGDGYFCASYTAEPGCDFPAYACQAPTDRCAVDRDCPAGQTCTVDAATKARVCRSPSCDVGRPFLVGGEARFAHSVSRDDWRRELSPDLTGLLASQREQLAAHWAHIGCLEHASIAAFARFGLELLTFGAPSELVELTNAALADETLHAKLAFGLASAYRGAPLGPGRLAITGAVEARSLRDSARIAFLEGCIGETVAALEAAAARDAAVDPCVRDVLARIAADEARHAELAYRFVRWAVDQLGPELAEELHALAAQALLEAHRGSPTPAWSHELSAHGMLSLGERRAIRAAALAEVVTPCVRELQNTAGSVYVPNTERSTSQISCKVA